MFINHREFDHEYDDVGQVDEVDNDDESDDVFCVKMMQLVLNSIMVMMMKM